MRRAAKLAVVALGMVVAGATWAQDQPAQIARGQTLYKYWCATCHGPGIGNGPRYLPGENALRAKYKGEVSGLLHERTDLTPEFVKLFVRQGVSIMPFFRKTEVSDPDLDAIVAYLLRNNPPQ